MSTISTTSCDGGVMGWSGVGGGVLPALHALATSQKQLAAADN